MSSPLQDPVPLADVRRALVTKLRHHGDVLLASPVFTHAEARGAARRDRRARLPRDRADARGPSGDRAAAHDRPRLEARRASSRRRAREMRAAARAARAPLRSPRPPDRASARPHARAPAAAALRRHARARRSTRRAVAAALHALLPAAARARRATRSRRISTRCAASACIRTRTDKRLVLVPGAAADARVDALLAQHGARAAATSSRCIRARAGCSSAGRPSARPR